MCITGSSIQCTTRAKNPQTKSESKQTYGKWVVKENPNSIGWDQITREGGKREREDWGRELDWESEVYGSDVKRNGKMGETKRKKRQKNKQGVQQSIRFKDHGDGKSGRNNKGESKEEGEIQKVWKDTSKTSRDQLRGSTSTSATETEKKMGRGKKKGEDDKQKGVTRSKRDKGRRGMEWSRVNRENNVCDSTV